MLQYRASYPTQTCRYSDTNTCIFVQECW